MILPLLPFCSLFLFLLISSPAVAADHLSNPLADRPRWESLAKYQETITRDDFERLLRNVYATRGINDDLIRIDRDFACILMNRDSQEWFTLRFASDKDHRKTASQPWRAANSLPKRKDNHPLSGVKIALDPGHIGGKWAKIEERWFKVGEKPPVEEGRMTLRVAKMLATKLRELGAIVTFVRSKEEPVTPLRANDFKVLAVEALRAAGTGQPRDKFDGPADPLKEQTVQWQSEIFFYRNSEIRFRAKRVNSLLHPDLVLCLHFNAEEWGDECNPMLVDKNHLHLLVNGGYLESELAFDDERFEMLGRLLSGVYDEELAIAEKVAPALANTTQLPPYQYTRDNATMVGTTGYLWARNLVATRLYQCPVVYFEPYVMNNSEVFDRIQAGDYQGTRLFNGIERRSIYREYVDGIVTGLLDYYREARK